MAINVYQNPYYAQQPGGPWSSLGPQLMGMPQLPPEAYIGSRNIPLQDLEFAAPGGGLSPFNSPVGAAAWNTFMTPGAPLSLPDMAFGRSNMQGGPSTGSASSYYMAMRQQADLARLRQLAESQDITRAKAVAKSLVNMQGYEGTDKQKEALAADMASQWVGALGAGSMFLPEGLEDALMPGGLTSSFSQRMYLAGTKARPAPGKYGLGVKEVDEISKELESKFRDAKGVEDRGYTRGFSMREFGETAVALSQRGLLDMNEGTAAGPGGKMMSQKQRITANIKEYINAMDAMKDLIGNPGASVDQLMSSLDNMFGSGLKSMPVSRIERMIDTAASLGQQNNISPTKVMEIYRNSAIAAKGYGMPEALGAISAEQALRSYSAGSMNWAAGAAAGDFSMQRRSEDERLASLQERSLRVTNSDFVKRSAALIRMSDQADNVFKGPLGDLVGKLKSGNMAEKDIRELMKVTESSGALYDAVTAQGVSRENYNAVISNKAELQNTAAKFNLSDVGMRANVTEYTKKVATQLGNTAANESSELYKFGVRDRAGAEKLVNYMYTAQDQSNAGLVGHLQKYEGFNKKLSEQEASRVFEVVRDTMSDKRILPAGETFEERIMSSSPKALAEADSRRAMDVAMNQGFRQSGIGRGPGGGAGLWQNAVRAFAASEGTTSAADVFAESAGGIPKEQLARVLETPGVKKELDAFKKVYAEKAALHKEIGELENTGGVELSAENSQKLKERKIRLAEVNEEFQKQSDKVNKYGGMITPEITAAKDMAEMQSGKFSRALSGTDKDRVDLLEATDVSKDIAAAGEQFKGTEDTDKAAMKELTGLYGEAKAAKQKALSKGGTEADRVAAVKALQKAKDREAELLGKKQEEVVAGKEKEIKKAGEAEGGWSVGGAVKTALKFAASPGAAVISAVADFFSPAKKIEEESKGSKGSKKGDIEIETTSKTGGPAMTIKGTIELNADVFAER